MQLDTAGDANVPRAATPGVGMTGEISHDLDMSDDNLEFAEGTFRLDGGAWQVYIFSTLGGKGVSQPVINTDGAWASGVTGVYVQLPAGTRFGKQLVHQLLAEALGVDRWIEVKGPDSMVLR